MATQTAPEAAWNDFRVATFAGQHDTHIETGEDYRTLTLATIFTMEPQARTKMAGAAFLPSSYHNYDARSHEAQREHGSFVALVGDVDKNDLSLDAIKAATERFADGAAWLIYSSAHSRDGDRRWRIILPLAAPAGFGDWFDAQSAFFTFMESAGVPMDRAMSRPGQPVYLPNVPHSYKDGTPLRDGEGAPIYYQTESSGLAAPGLDISRGIVAGGISSIKQQRAADDRERELVRKAAAERHANRPRNDGANIIETFNSTTSLPTMLELCGYQQSPRDPSDWRSPLQTGDTYATRIIEGKWVSLSASDAAAGIGSAHRAGCYGDAYDLYAHYKHGGDHKAAYRELGREQRGHNVVQGNFRGEDGDPGWQDMPEWVQSEPVDAAEIEPDFSAAPLSSPLPLIWFDENTPFLSGNWIVKNVLPAEAFCTIIGHPGCGKSFLALDMALHIAAGRRWQDRKVNRGLVIYLAAEGQRGQQNRVEAWKRHYDAQGLDFAMIPVAINLGARTEDMPKLFETIQAALHRCGVQLAALVVDTLNRTFGGGDENGTDMSEYVGNIGKVQATFGCTVIVVHHIPKNSETVSERGHGSLRGAIETSLVISSDAETGVRTLLCKKQKDAEDGWKMQFKLKVVELGEDEDGDPVTSCVVVPVEAGQELQEVKRGPSLSATQRQALNELQATLQAHRIGIPNDFPIERRGNMDGGLATSRKVFQERWTAIAASDKTPEVAAATFRRVVTDLQNKGLAGCWNDFIWAVRS